MSIHKTIALLSAKRCFTIAQDTRQAVSIRQNALKLGIVRYHEALRALRHHDVSQWVKEGQSSE